MMIKKVLSNVELLFSFCIAKSFRGKSSLFCLPIFRKNAILYDGNHKVTAVIEHTGLYCIQHIIAC